MLQDTISTFSINYLVGVVKPKKLYVGCPYNASDIRSDSLQYITFGHLLTSIDNSYIYASKLECIYSNSMNPPTLNQSYFSNKQYLNATLYVPTGTKALYEAAYGWKNFFIIVEHDVTAGIEQTVANGDVQDSQIVGIYTIDGRKVNSLQKGVNILKYSDGTTRKVMRNE